MLAEWDDSYSVGVKSLDESNRLLFDFINEFFYAARRETSRGHLQEIIGRLLTFSNDHFSDEERYMVTYDYPERERHTHEHRKIQSRIIEISSRRTNGHEPRLDDILSVLIDWLQKHLADTDKEFGTFLNARGVR